MLKKYCLLTLLLSFTLLSFANSSGQFVLPAPRHHHKMSGQKAAIHSFKPSRSQKVVLPSPVDEAPPQQQKVEKRVTASEMIAARPNYPVKPQVVKPAKPVKTTKKVAAASNTHAPIKRQAMKPKRRVHSYGVSHHHKKKKKKIKKTKKTKKKTMRIKSARWVLYVGTFTGFYYAKFDWHGAYVVSTNSLETDSMQMNVTGGGQVGLQYLFKKPFFIGMVLSAAGHGGDADVSTLISGVSGQFFNFNQQFSVDYQFDIAGIIGYDVTPVSHLYLKVGASDANFKYQVTTIPTVLTRTQTVDTWGWLIGVGVAYDLSQRVSLFAEFNYNHYGRTTLNTLVNVDPRAVGVVNSLSQHVDLRARSARVGLNVKFAI